MSYSSALISALAVLPLARGIAFGGPAPTATSPDRALVGLSPKPTKGPSVAELRRRQSSLFPETCGWIDGDYYSGLTCSYGRTCMLYTASGVGMAGCCDGSDTQDCGWVNSCVDYDAYTAGGCDSDCELNTFVRKCSNSLYPYCHTWTYPGDNVLDYGCTDLDYPVETVLQTASDTLSDTTSISLPTVDGDAVTGWDGSSATGGSVFTTTDSDGSSFETSFPSSGGSSSSGGRKKKVSVAVIAGAVVGALILLFVIGAVIIFLCVKKKKAKQLAANQQAVAAAQASRPQSQYPPQQPQMMQQQMAPPMPPQTPQPQYNAGGYFAPQGQQDQKPQVHEYGLQSPISNPPTPAPAYVQPYYAAPNAPPMPSQSPAPYQAREPTPGAHEVDAISAVRPPPGQGQNGPVYEIGHGRS